MSFIISNNPNEINTDNKLMRSALIYAEQLNFHVFPVHSFKGGQCTCGSPNCSNPAKHPVTRNGVKDATNDLDAIRRYWTQYPWANIGVATGAVSGIFVLDVDTGKVNGKETLEELESEHGKLPDTVQSITGSGGEHYLFKYQEGLKNKVGFRPSLDIRSDGGYIVAAPSIHASGNQYSWELSSRPIDNEIVEAPQWLLNLVTEPFYTHGETPQAKPSTHWQKLMDGLAEGEGRNHATASLTGHLLARRVDLVLVYELVHLWNNERNTPPLSEDELNRTIISIANKEMERRGKW